MGLNRPKAQTPSSSEGRKDLERDVLFAVNALIEPYFLQVLDISMGKSHLKIVLEPADSLYSFDDERSSSHADVVTLDTISEVSRLISSELDKEDFGNMFAGSYELEVSSAGIERPLRALNHFLRFVGSSVEIQWKEPSAQLKSGKFTIADVSSQGIIKVIDQETGNELLTSLSDIKKARTVVDWGASNMRRNKTGVLPSVKDRSKQERAVLEMNEDG